MSYASTSKAKDNVQNRGDKGSSLLGTTAFLGLRTADVVLEYHILRHGLANNLITKLGGDVLLPGPAAVTHTPLDVLGLSPYRLVILAMSFGAAAKQVYWLTATSYERLPLSTAIPVGIFNGVGSTINTLLFLCRQTSASANGERFPQTPLLIGAVLYAVGIVVESLSETQRYLFKKDPKNKGKVYTGGLFSVARHINFTGYVTWRIGYGIAAGGYAWGLFNFAMVLVGFWRAIPPLNHYCEERYGEQWQQYKRQTPYKMLPGVW
ncbi:hypothetical protein K461DRAFT_224906 [Myriangium duriaei CBS 260.36]|uniref:Steroid 5-alpha reductase C-terminal domain-containing protein n=1 Tax=Myriangium duriaei CBS 260.36 TaxID=1168546 RepID=A0A9P4J4S4_9PEZI|nr:hypothetical protein K461DRAFT_224906 [Myriangium duriaei CBS 260.36]